MSWLAAHSSASGSWLSNGRHDRADGFGGSLPTRHDGGMSTWKPHSLARPRPDQLDLRRGDRVVSKVPLPGVPDGTEGRVILANGFNWMRYRVRFRNGAEVADLDERHLTPTGKTARRLAKANQRG